MKSSDYGVIKHMVQEVWNDDIYSFKRELNRIREVTRDILIEIYEQLELIKSKQNDLSLAPYSPDELLTAVVDKLKKHSDFNTNPKIAEKCATLMKIIDSGELFIIRNDKQGE